jgi:hypothetical protein
MAEGYQVTPDDLDGAAQGVHAVLDQLAQLGPDRGRAGQGRGTVAIALATGPLAHQDLHEALGEFGTRWEWGVRSAVQSGRRMADDLAATARSYRGGDAAPAGLFGRILADAVGDPRADPARAGGRSPATIAADANRPETAADRVAAEQSVADTWSATVADAWRNSPAGMAAEAGAGRDPLQYQRDDLAALRRIAE